MRTPLEISFHGIAASPALRDAITDRVAKLERLAPDIISCRVTVEYDGRRHRQGNLYRLNVRMVLPGGELYAGHSPRANAAHEDPYVAVRDTFDALRRQLEDHLRRVRGDVKRHAPSA